MAIPSVGQGAEFAREIRGESDVVLKTIKDDKFS